MPEPEFSAEEAVARFFPRSFDYDHATAVRLMEWLAECGYAVVRKEALTARPLQGDQPLSQPLRGTKEKERLLEEVV